MKTTWAIAIVMVVLIVCLFPGMPLNRHSWVDLTLFSGWPTYISMSDCPQIPPKAGETCNVKVHFAVDVPARSEVLDIERMRLQVCKKHGEVRAVITKRPEGLRY